MSRLLAILLLAQVLSAGDPVLVRPCILDARLDGGSLDIGYLPIEAPTGFKSVKVAIRLLADGKTVAENEVELVAGRVKAEQGKASAKLKIGKATGPFSVELALAGRQTGIAIADAAADGRIAVGTVDVLVKDGAARSASFTPTGREMRLVMGQPQALKGWVAIDVQADVREPLSADFQPFVHILDMAKAEQEHIVGYGHFELAEGWFTKVGVTRGRLMFQPQVQGRLRVVCGFFNNVDYTGGKRSIPWMAGSQASEGRMVLCDVVVTGQGEQMTVQPAP
jgi:hypothetical protein